MGTLWRVEDDSVAIFADRFYYHHRSGADWAEASALAARDFISGNEWLVQGGQVQMLTDPFYWAAFNAIRPALQ
jgi:CHAT domain-containing protein